MASSRLPVPALLSVLLFTVVSSVIAQNTPQDYLAIHNTTRSSVGVGPMVWNATVAAYAQSYAVQRQGDCNLVHSNGPYGENLFKGSGKEWTALEAVQLWVDERQFYNYTTNTCAAGKVCGHYTQVVWRNSVNLGCARVKCTSGAIFITCNYSPRGNYVGQRPY